MLRGAVAADADGAMSDNVIPEVDGSGAVGIHVLASLRLGILSPHALEADEFGNLCVGVLVVKEVWVVGVALHPIDLMLMAVALRRLQVFHVAEESESIGQRLVHATVFPPQYFLHVGFGEVRDDIDSPVRKTTEELQRRLVASVNPCIT